MAKDIATIQEIFDLIETAILNYQSTHARNYGVGCFDKAYYYDGFRLLLLKNQYVFTYLTPTAIDVEYSYTNRHVRRI